MDCVTRKVCFETEEKALEALINNRIQFNTGPNNFYFCIDCGNYHLTSMGNEHKVLSDTEVKKRIERERNSGFWQGKVRR